MEYKIKIISIIVITTLLLSIYFIFFYGTDETDDEAPIIEFVSGDISIYSGNTVESQANFESDQPHHHCRLPC